MSKFTWGDDPIWLYSIHFCTIFSHGWLQAPGYTFWRLILYDVKLQTLAARRGGNAELAAAVPGLEVVAGHKDAVTWWWFFGDWITSKGLVVKSVHTRAFFGFQTGRQTTTNQWSQTCFRTKMFIHSVRIVVSTCGTVHAYTEVRYSEWKNMSSLIHRLDWWFRLVVYYFGAYS